MKQFINSEAYIIEHRCCGYCTRLLAGNTKCLHEECVAAKLCDSTFIEVCIEKQLQSFFLGIEELAEKNFVLLMQFSF